jgi:hypothetical protein
MNVYFLCANLMKADLACSFAIYIFTGYAMNYCMYGSLALILYKLCTHSCFFCLECHRKQKGRKLSGTIMTAEQRLASDLKVTDTQIYIYMVLFA